MAEDDDLPGPGLDVPIRTSHHESPEQDDHEDAVADVMVQLRRRGEPGRHCVADDRGPGEVVGLDEDTASEECVGVPQPLADGQSATATFTPRPAPQLGDGAVALTVHTEPEEGPDLFLDLVAVRVGNAIVFTNGERYEGDPAASLDPGRLNQLTERAVEKAQQTLTSDR